MEERNKGGERERLLLNNGRQIFHFTPHFSNRNKELFCPSGRIGKHVNPHRITHLIKQSVRNCSACSEQCGGKLGFVSSVTTLNMAAVGSKSYHGGCTFSISTTVAPTLLQTDKQDESTRISTIFKYVIFSIYCKFKMPTPAPWFVLHKFPPSPSQPPPPSMSTTLPYISSVCVRFPLDNFRGHPVRSPVYRFQAASSTTYGLESLRCSKIGEFNIAIGISENVCTFNVSVDYPVVMEISHTFQDLSSVFSCKDLI